MFGNYAGFIVASYGVCLLTIGLLVLWVMIDGRAQAKALADLEARGIRRRSNRATNKATAQSTANNG